MTAKVYGFGMYGMFGQVADPGDAERAFCQRVASLGVNIGNSPYRDYQCGDIAKAIASLPESDLVFVWGDSLGANNSPWVGAAVSRRIDGIWGFQASVWGAQVPVTANVHFAHEAYNPNWIETFGLGAYAWTLAQGNRTTKLVLTTNNDLHPGDYDGTVQDMFLADMKSIIGS